jgi:hypothetical protein
MADASNANTFLEEYEFYAKPENQEPRGPAQRRKRPNEPT